MANFQVEVLPITVETHPDPEVTRLEVGRIGDYRVVVGKGNHQTGDLVAYIPEQAIVPDALLEELGLTGKLAGSKKNRVKVTKFRGVMSQGLVYKAQLGWELGQDVTQLLGITKYEPVIPSHMQGEMQSTPDVSLKFDIENIKRYPDIFVEGEEVVYTEKVHGTFVMIGLVHEDFRKPDMLGGKFFVSSKGLGCDGLYFKDNEKNSNNIYVRAFKQYGLGEKLEAIRDSFVYRPCKQHTQIMEEKATVWLLGEVFGGQKGYGYGANGAEPGFRAFAIKVGYEHISNRDMFESLCDYNFIRVAPVLYRGPFSKETLAFYTNGKETITGKESHIREGVVVTPTVERRDPSIGRVILKSVSDEYLGKSTGEETA